MATAKGVHGPRYDGIVCFPGKSLQSLESSGVLIMRSWILVGYDTDCVLMMTALRAQGGRRNSGRVTLAQPLSYVIVFECARLFHVFQYLVLLLTGVEQVFFSTSPSCTWY